MITNIILKDNRFTVFAKIDDKEEVMTFMPEVTAKDITAWLQEKIDYNASLNVKLEQLKAELVGLEAKYSEVPEIKEVLKR
jgi:hypothetical protein